jgi:NADH-quinone oxidoreductase subunit L
MLLPLLLLAIGAIASGFIGQNILHMISFENNFFANAIFVQPENKILEEIHHTPELIKSLPLILGVVAIAGAYLFYVIKPQIPARLAKILSLPYKISFNKWYFDEIYDKIFVQSIKKLGLRLWQFWDNKIIDGLGPNGLAATCRMMAGRVSQLQTGYIYHYALAMSLGVVGALLYLILRTIGIN